MQYLIMLMGDGEMPPWEEMSEQEQAEVMRRFEAFAEACAARDGVELLAEAELAGPEQARSLRVRDGELLVTEGPYAEGVEGLGGLSLIEAPDFETLLELVRLMPPYDMQIQPVLEREA